MTNHAWVLAVMGISLVASSCSRNRSKVASPETEASESSEAESVDQAPQPPPLSLVHASAVVSDCPDAKWMHTRAAHKSIQKIIDPCIAVPGGKAHFSATLIPGGRIELASPSGNPDEGVVPTCVLKDQNLRHQVFLKNRCSFDVVIEERPEERSSPSEPQGDTD